MLSRLLLIAAALVAALVVAAPAPAAEWHAARRIDEIGAGAAIVFTPDLALPGNRHFYERLGFLYIETSDWKRALEQVDERNALGQDPSIETVIVESHGTNGHGLKLQASKKPRAERSYISAGALQEKLGAAGVSRAYISACNAGRLLRPRIYRTLDRNPGDPLFLPPTLGVIDASSGFDPESSTVQILRRDQSHLETLMHASSSELGERARETLEGGGGELRFVISTMFIQLVSRDPRLELTSGSWVSRRSRVDIHPDDAEMLFREFTGWLESVARAGEEPLLEMEKARIAGPSRKAGID